MIGIIDKSSDTPLHHQLYKILEQKILKGDFKEGEIIPSESEMQSQYKLSRITVRRAISDLEHDGFVRKIKGKGTVIQPLKINREIDVFQSFTKNAISTGRRPSSVILELDYREAPSKVAELLGIELGQNIYYLKRLRLLNGRIIALNITYIRSDLGIDKIEYKDFNEETSLYDFLESRGIKLGAADETMESRIAYDEVMRDLFLSENTPILYKERVSYDINNKPIEYSEISYIGDKYRYNIHLTKVRKDN